MSIPVSLSRDISPPRPIKKRKCPPIAQSVEQHVDDTIVATSKPSPAAVEAGKAKITDHLTYFERQLSKVSRGTPPHVPRLSIPDFVALYKTSHSSRGHHFVVHQHDHPKAGVHYDLRLQFSETSSLSFAVPKGLPGNPNSKSIGRMAIETRVHNFWNHLLESASSKTGSLLIWDTGTYEVLPRTSSRKRSTSPRTTDDESESSDSPSPTSGLHDARPENKKLIAGFRTRYIRLRLHGTKLPKNYTVILRLPTNEIIKRPSARRKSKHKRQVHAHSHVDADDDIEVPIEQQPEEPDLNTDTDEDAETRANNAYPGSTNDIGSVHQRHWFLQLDRHNSGFALDSSQGYKGTWLPRSDGGGFEPFLVRGRDFERSVVTGRLAREVESDEGIDDYQGRGGWIGIEH